jgi:uncharacterized membrane-anchored protein
MTPIAVIGWSIVRYERILARGTAYRIRTAPVDPADAFRGRYVQVGPSIVVGVPSSEREKQLLDEVVAGRGSLYVRLATDPEGFASAAGITSEPPANGDYLRVEEAGHEWTQTAPSPAPDEVRGYRLMFPFDRYYMSERAAPAAVQRYREALGRDANRRAWVAVRVLAGSGVIDGLFIDGVPIEHVARAK